VARVVSFAELFDRITRPIDLPDEGEYRLVGVHLKGKGAFLREVKPGLAIRKKRHYVIRAGDIIYNKLFAWRGAFAVVSPALDGCYVSDKYPAYQLRREDVLPAFLELVFRSDSLAKQAEARSVGSAAMSKFTLNPPRFFELRCELPSKSEQERLVGIARKLDGEIERLTASVDHSLYVVDAFVGRYVEAACSRFPTVRLREIGDLVRRSIKINDGETYRQVTIAMNNRGVRLRGEKWGYQIAVKNQAVVHAGDVVFSRIDIRNGAIGIVPDDLDGAVVANDFPVYVLNENVCAQYVELAFRTPAFREQCVARSAGSTNRKKMRRDVFLDLQINLPPLDAQRKIVKQVKRLKESLGSIKGSSERLRARAEVTRQKLLNELAPSG